jgi:hypothetical protein
MATYRLYCLDQGNHITDRLDFDADDDAAAIALATARYPDSTCEIWELGRKVAVTARQRVA